MQVKHLPDAVRFSRMTTAELREEFLLENLFKAGEIAMVYIHLDRAIVGSAVPTDKILTPEISKKELAADFLLQRREIGIINIGASGKVIADTVGYSMENRDCVYLGMGTREIGFASDDPLNPAQFYLLSYPAHAKYPNATMRFADATSVKLGNQSEANCRTLHKYIFQQGLESCQLVMGLTELNDGSVWNTMPAHTHERRSEIYLYFNVKNPSIVCHLMGKPDETRHIIMRDKQVVISPSWSIHSAAGTRAYSFIWGMGGENQDFDDMDGVEMDRLR